MEGILAFERLGSVLGVSCRVLKFLWVSWVRLKACCGHPWGVLGRLGSKKVANMVPTWSPKRSQNREKIEAKIDQNLDGSWGRIFERVWWIWEGKMDPSWDQNRTKNPCEHRNAILRKSCSHCSGGANFLDSEVQVGSKNRSKIDHKMRSTWEGILASIFDRFWWILGAKLGSKIDQKSMLK